MLRKIAGRWQRAVVPRLLPALPSTSYRLVKQTLEQTTLTRLARDIAGSGETTSVADGPFRGQLVHNKAEHLRLPQILGTYEQELHPFLVDFQNNDYDYIVNIGSGDGYYAVGLACMFSGAHILAVDIDAQARHHCMQRARLNAVEDRIEVSDSAAITLPNGGRLHATDRVLYVIDCEGCEKDLLTGLPPDAFANADLIVECHDFRIPGITDALRDHFASTHTCTRVEQGARNPHTIAPLATYDETVRWLAVCEHRPRRMHWLIFRRGG